MKNTLKKSIFAFMLIAMVASCSKDDDINEIFTDREWELSFIQEGSFRISSDKRYTITFGSSSFDAALPDGKSIKGKWKADGDKRTFSCTDVHATETITDDSIAGKMLKILTKAKKYEGDTHYIKIMEQNNVYLQFHNY